MAADAERLRAEVTALTLEHAVLCEKISSAQAAMPVAASTQLSKGTGHTVMLALEEQDYERAEHSCDEITSLTRDKEALCKQLSSAQAAAEEAGRREELARDEAGHLGSQVAALAEDASRTVAALRGQLAEVRGELAAQAARLHAEAAQDKEALREQLSAAQLAAEAAANSSSRRDMESCGTVSRMAAKLSEVKRENAALVLFTGALVKRAGQSELAELREETVPAGQSQGSPMGTELDKVKREHATLVLLTGSLVSRVEMLEGDVKGPTTRYPHTERSTEQLDSPCSSSLRSSPAPSSALSTDGAQ